MTRDDNRSRRKRGMQRASTFLAVMMLASTMVVPAQAGKPNKTQTTTTTTTTAPASDSPAGTFSSAASAAAYLGSGSTLAVPVPSGAAAGDLLIAQISYNAAGEIGPPAGWTVIDVATHPTKPIMQGLYWRRATDAEPADYGFMLKSGKADTVVGVIAAYGGIDLQDPIDAVAVQYSDPGVPSLAAPSITTTVNNTLVVGFFTARDNGAMTPPDSMVERWDLNSGAGVGAIGETVSAAADEVFETTGATGTRTAVAEASDGGVAHLVALKPASGEGTGTDTTTLDTSFTQWEDAGHLQGLPPGQHAGSMEWITNQVTGANHFWNAGFTGAGIDVALIDSGVVPVDGLTYPGKVINGVDLSFESQADNLRYLDTYGHGTHLAGIIAGRDDADSAFSGMAPGARIVNVKVADSQGAVDVSQVIAAIDWVVQHRNDNGMNIRVITLAYGSALSQPYQIDPLSYAVEQAWEAGIVVVVAAGNDGNASPLRNPAIDPFVIAVGSADNDSSKITGVSAFSNCGTSKRFVDLVAPGRSILSLRNPGSYADVHFPEATVANSYFLGSGTSQSAAVVAGGVALLLEQRPELTPDQVKAMLMDNAQYVQGADFTCQGAGALDLGAVERARTPRVNSTDQTYEMSDGTGSLEASRGDIHVYDEGIALVGEIDIMSSPWTGYCTVDGKTTTCLDTLWDGGTFNGASWSGASWSGASWSGASWSGASWSGASWSGASWSSKSWSGASWSGASWSGASWSGASWSGASWSGDSWLGLSWN